MHQRRQTRPRAARRRLVIAFSVAVGLGLILHAGTAYADDYNSNPTYCHDNGPLDPLWWWFACYLPDPPGKPY